MDTIVAASGLSLPNLILGLISLGWLIYRIRKVVETPVDDLIKLLGLEVPVAPVVTLLEVTSHNIAVQWKTPEQRPLAVKHVVKVNGSHAGDISSHEHAISITNLKPGHFYLIRIIAVNSAGFQASSEVIRVRTCEDGVDTGDGANDEDNAMPAITPYKPFFDSMLAANNTPIITREHSGSISHPKRASTIRRPSPVIPHEPATPPSEFDSVEIGETIATLATRLDMIRKDIDETDRQDDEDEKQYETLQLSLAERREQLRQHLRERDDDSNDLKRNVTSLERQNTAVQVRKAKQEKLLSQKRSERDKFRDDTFRWKTEALQFQEEVEELAVQRQEFQTNTHDQVAVLRQDQDQDLHTLKSLEERLGETRRDIKGLEEEQQTLDDDPNTAIQLERQRKAKHEDYEWSEKMNILQARYQSAWTACNQAQESFAQIQHRLDYITERHNSQATQYGTQYSDVPSNATDASPVPLRGSLSNQEHNRIPSQSGRQIPHGLVFQSPSPFFNSSDPITAPARSPMHEGMSEAEAEMLTGGALASPTAGALLPAGLFGDEQDEAQTGAESVSRANATIPYLPGLGVIPAVSPSERHEEVRPEVASPMSLRSPSLSSPHGSISNFHQNRLSDGRLDSDRRSIRSTSSSTRTPSRRFVDFFGLQRSRAISNEGLPLGALKPFESRSLPRHEDAVAEEPNEVAGSGRRVTSSGGLFGSVSQAFNRMGTASSKVIEEGEEGSPSAHTNRTAHLSIFGKGNNIWATRTNSPRPSSMYSNYSFENVLPVPVENTQPFGWPASDTLEPQPNTRHGSISYPWSSAPSRRQSVQPVHHQSSLSISNVPEPDPQELAMQENSAPQAPIGTKPRKFKEELSQVQLNPNARDFRSMLGIGLKNDKKKSESPRVSEDNSFLHVDLAEPRKSKETRNSSAAESMDEHEDQAAGGSPAKSVEGTKESFMRKMTRKGSSGKFSLSSSLKEKGGSLFSRKPPSSEEVVEVETGFGLTRSVDSVGSVPISGDKRGLLASFKRRKRGTETPSISEASVASETGDEGEDRPSVEFDDY